MCVCIPSNHALTAVRSSALVSHHWARRLEDLESTSINTWYSDKAECGLPVLNSRTSLVEVDSSSGPLTIFVSNSFAGRRRHSQIESTPLDLLATFEVSPIVWLLIAAVPKLQFLLNLTSAI